LRIKAGVVTKGHMEKEKKEKTDTKQMEEGKVKDCL